VTAYFKAFEERDEAQKNLIGTIVNGTEYTEEDYQRWRLTQIGRGERYEAMRDKLAERYTKANETAIAYVNDATPGIYSLNRNYSAYTIEKVAGDVGFTMFDESAVKRLITEQPGLMPNYPKAKAVKRGIDLEYGKKQITKSVTSGIIQGQSTNKIAANLMRNMTEMNRTSAVRAARTAVTGAQNAGRQDSYEAAQQMGIKVRKQWLATLDDRTRASHQELDGVTVDVDEAFPNGCEYPGDPAGDPSEVYNCRCSLISVVEGVDTSDALRRDKYGPVPSMTFSQWENQKRGEGYLQR
jgi:SPP1 gp7 family putative phage head morphogenesis protein